MTNKMTKSVESKGKNSLRKGFTLVELLVVVAIIAILASLSIGGVSSVMKKAKIRDSQQLVMAVKVGVESFHAEYSGYPMTTAGVGDVVVTLESGDPVLGELYGEVSAINYRKRQFVEVKDGNNGASGLVRDAAGAVDSITDSWGNPLQLVLDLDFDGLITDPTDAAISVPAKVLVYSRGPDEMAGTADDICSWK